MKYKERLNVNSTLALIVTASQVLGLASLQGFQQAGYGLA